MPNIFWPSHGQFKAARHILNLSQSEAAKKCFVSQGVVWRLEREGQSSSIAMMKRLKAGYERMGITFLDDGFGEGVWLQRDFVGGDNDTQ